MPAEYRPEVRWLTAVLVCVLALLKDALANGSLVPKSNANPHTSQPIVRAPGQGSKRRLPPDGIIQMRPVGHLSQIAERQ